MFRRLITGTAVAFLASSTLLADFSYHEKTTITGGMVASLMKVAGVFSKAAREPVEGTVSVKGDRMVNRSSTHTTVIDLGAQTITTIDTQKKTYTVMTFEQMKEMLDQATQKMQKKGADQPNVEIKVSSEKTGNTRQISGLDAKELLVKLEMQSTDPQSGQSGTMLVTTHMWIAPAASGYSEVREFYRRMAEKLNWTPNGGMFAGRQDVAKGMAEVYKQAATLDGMPVFETVVMSMAGQGGATPSGDAAQQQPQQQQQQQAQRPSLGGALGGALGIGRKKQSSNDPPPQQSSSGTPGSLVEMQMEMSAFSPAPVDDSQFAIPAGFKKVEPDARRR